MKIIFAGQAKLSERIRVLAGLLARAQHTVTVYAPTANTPRSLRNLHGVHLMRIPSLLPHEAGGWFYTVATVIRLCFERPQAVHIHGWKLAAFVPVLGALLAEAVMVWTVDTLPQGPQWLVRACARQAAYLGLAVTVTRRDLQWHLLQLTGIQAAYIPDGYSEDETPLVSPRRWDLWTGRYVLATAYGRAELAWIAEAYASVQTRKKLVVLTANGKEVTSLARKYPFLTIVETESLRVARSLMSGAAAIILGSPGDSTATILAAMRADKPCIALAESFHEETLGVTAQYVKEGDTANLISVLAAVLRPSAQKTGHVRKGSVRAETHFRWERIFLDYLHVYQPAAFLVPIDSAQNVKFTEPVVN